MARWCRGYWSSQGRVEKGWNWVAECNIQRPSQTPSLVVFIRHIISEVLQYRRHPFRARRHTWSEPDAILGGSPLNRDFANIRSFSPLGDFDQWRDGVEGIGHPREG